MITTKTKGNSLTPVRHTGGALHPLLSINTL